MSSSLNIRIATITDLDNINLLFKKVVADVHNVKKIDMWNTEYPFCEFEGNIKNKEMYVIESNNSIIGSFALTEFDDPEYHVINWTSNNEKWFYINRLVILPSEQGKGYAKETMQFICDYAIKNNFEVMRLTVHKDNKYAIGLYEKFGFIKIENSYWVIGDKVFIEFEKRFKEN